MLSELNADHLPLVRMTQEPIFPRRVLLTGSAQGCRRVSLGAPCDLRAVVRVGRQVTVWNKIDAVASPDTIRAVASAREREGTVCISAATGEGTDAMLALLDRYIAALLLPVRCMLPFSQVRPGHAASRNQQVDANGAHGAAALVV